MQAAGDQCLRAVFVVVYVCLLCVLVFMGVVCVVGATVVVLMVS